PTPTPTPTPTPSPPTAPSNLVGAALSASQISLTWSDNSYDETGFQIERSTNGITFTAIAIVAPETINYVDGGLTSNTFYHYRIRAFNAVGSSTSSNSVKLKTKKF
ncbi:MAG: fibronectin type III domain-containing protein, partial [Pyrinomonadaceae bacterium]|nr:fibronectin type III domain-containing protein [Pyrinomonadaceae bacterium]